MELYLTMEKYLRTQMHMCIYIYMSIKKEKCIINLTSFHYYVAINDLNSWLLLHILHTICWATKKFKVTYTFRNATGSNKSYNFRHNN